MVELLPRCDKYGNMAEVLEAHRENDHGKSDKRRVDREDNGERIVQRKKDEKGEWTEEEDEIIIKALVELGNKWVEIAKKLKGRTENSLKNHWNAVKRKLLSRQGFQSSKHQKSSSLLQSYIKSLIKTSNIKDIESNACNDANMQTLNDMIGPSTQLADSVEFFAGDGLVPN
ncbi:transcription factor MYB115-like [Telopea speciosissima]|uniref:transcription factor MYB115-like n=1 Tax=Telopea speciosissima TaxID=54955 RepID=UPI001CC6BC62|nr:transcription factor MYB115-like [Telopea speciosissima]